MIKEYKYQCKDYSIITPPFKKWVVEPLMRFIPWFLPANIITIIANIFLYLAIYLTFIYQYELYLNFIFIPVLIFLYTIGDHMDGSQAKRTGTSSALGEYCDHYMDAFNTGIILIILIMIFKISNMYVISYLFFTSYISHASVIYEEYKTGWLVFDKIGAIESVFAIAAVILIGAIQPVFIFFISITPIFNLSVIEVIVIISSTGSFLTFLKNVKRVNITSLKFFLFSIFLLFITAYCTYHISIRYTFIIITFYSADYIGKLMRGHLIDSVERFPDLITPVVLLISFMYTLPFDKTIFITFYLLFNLIWTSFNIIYPLKDKWVWKNPSKV